MPSDPPFLLQQFHSSLIYSTAKGGTLTFLNMLNCCNNYTEKIELLLGFSSRGILCWLKYLEWKPSRVEISSVQLCKSTEQIVCHKLSFLLNFKAYPIAVSKHSTRDPAERKSSSTSINLMYTEEELPSLEQFSCRNRVMASSGRLQHFPEVWKCWKRHCWSVRSSAMPR